ncbi:MAG: S8 family serine peptidase, partial [Nonlabens sp.]|nr:S8 family serine peptidase [Nonlabens sp.]
TLLGNIAQAQTKAETQKIISNYNLEEGNLIVESIINSEKVRMEAAKTAADIAGMPYSYVDERGEPVILNGVDILGNPTYITTDNFTGARTINAHLLYNGGTLGLNIQGQGINAGIWDGGYVRQTHVAVAGRVTYGEPNKATSGHGTHVGGTMISDGTGNIGTRGVAFNGTLTSFDFDSDTGEMVQQAIQGMLISNHSYGLQVNSGTNNAIFGKYDVLAQTFDNITNSFDYYLPVVSAGNDRGAGFNTSKGGFDLLTDRTLSKNSMVVGAVGNVAVYTDPSSVMMSDFSSWGPCDDGRIKPDIVAKGVAVMSLSDGSDNATATLQGTSMSAPMVSGGLMLLQQLYNQQQGNFMRAYTLKGVALMNTKEAGDNPGPDYSFGWGLMDVAASASHIINMNDTSLIDERVLSQGTTYTRTVTSNGAMLKVGIFWNDPAGNLPNNTTDNPLPALVNDLDIKLTNASGVDFFPWKLSVSQPALAATKGINNVDNVEIVEILAPAGTYTITVSHKGTLAGNGTERYALLINGADTGTLSTATQELNNFVMYPNPAQSEVTV